MSALLNTTNEAEGLPRRRFTVDEIDEMTRAGILHEHERVELIGGELVPMAAKGGFHERMKTGLNLHWAQRLPAELIFSTETTFRLSPDTYLEPDFVFYPKAVGWNGLAAGTARLAVEISDTSLRFDLGRKAGIYARFGIVELWVVNAVTREARVHREPRPDGYGRVRDYGRTRRSCRLAPKPSRSRLPGSICIEPHRARRGVLVPAAFLPVRTASSRGGRGKASIPV